MTRPPEPEKDTSGMKKTTISSPFYSGRYAGEKKESAPEPVEVKRGGGGSSPSSTSDIINTTRPSSQETVSENVGPSPTRETTRPQDSIGMGPGGVNAPGLINQTKEELIKEAGKPPAPTEKVTDVVPMPEWWEPTGTERYGPTGGYTEAPPEPIKVDLPDPGLVDTLASRNISTQESISVEGERELARQRELGRQQIDYFTEQSRYVSDIIVGPVENIPKTETAPRAFATAVEFAIMLPSETLRSPVSASELAFELKEEGVIGRGGVDIGKATAFIKENVISPVVKDPAGAGVRAGLTLGLIVVPAVKGIRGLRSSRSSVRTTPSYEIAAVPEEVPINSRYLTDMVFEPKGESIKGTGRAFVVTEAGESLVDVSTVTTPKGNRFITDVEATRLGRTKMDNPAVDDIVGRASTRKGGKGKSVTDSVILSEKSDAQLNLAGRPAPEQELAVRRGTSYEVSRDLEMSVGRSSTRKSIMNMEAADMVDVSGSKLLLEQRIGQKVRRMTLTREVLLESRMVKEKIFSPEDLGFSQDTLRAEFGFYDPLDPKFLEGGGRGGFRGYGTRSEQISAAEEALKQALRSRQRPPAPPAPEPTPGIVRGRGATVSRARETPKPPLPRPGRYPPKGVLEEEQYIRYPPSEAPPEPVQAILNRSDMALDSTMGLGLDEVVRTSSRRSRGSRTIPRMAYLPAERTDNDMGMQLRQMQRQLQAQQLQLELRQQTRQRVRFIIPELINFPRTESGLAPIDITPRSPWGGGALPPMLPGFLAEMRARERGGRAPRRRYEYLPTLAGIASGRTLGAAPRGLLSGLEPRAPVRR